MVKSPSPGMLGSASSLLLELGSESRGCDSGVLPACLGLRDMGCSAVQLLHSQAPAMSGMG